MDVTRSLKFSPFSVLIFLALPAVAQNFDSSGNATLSGSYFVREIVITGQNTTGAIASAASVTGGIVFDGKGGYTFNGQAMNSAAGPTAALTLSGTYQVAANGFVQMQSLANVNDFAYGGVSSIGPSAFVASATEGNVVDILVAIPAGVNVTNSALNGSYSYGYIDFLNANIGMVREATFTANADGSGNLGNIAVAGSAVNLGGSATTQTIPGVTYSIAGNGAGTVNFGAASSTQLLSGVKILYVSPDQNIVLGGSTTGFDLLVAIKSLTGAANNATSAGEYYMAGLEDSTGNIDAFYGSANATGTGTAIYHNRIQSFAQSVYDYTYNSHYTVSANGTFAPADIPYQVTLGIGGRAFIATGGPGLYALVVGLGTYQYSGPGVYLNPLGIVNAASFAPITNPIAPSELVSLFGTGLAASTLATPGLPLGTSLGGVQVTINGTPVPLFYVSPNQIAILVPSSISPANGVNYATVQVINNGVTSNSVTVYTNRTAPGVFSAGGSAAAQHADYSPITSSSPAKTGETVILYAGGGGSVSPAIPDGSASPANPLSMITSPIFVDFGGHQAQTPFAGLTPGLVGLYQLNTVIPSGTAAGDVYVDVSTPDAYTSEATLNLAVTGSAPAKTIRRNRRETSGVPHALQIY